MITVNIQLPTGLDEKLKTFQKGGAGYDSVLRGTATSMLAVVKTRIHEQGKDATGAEIGTYTPGYMAVRTGVFKSNAKFSKGKNKGETKPTGVFTKGPLKGSPRPNYNRTNDTKVVISLTRQMENDFSVIATEDGYGLGYNNSLNFQKAGWVEATYDKKIFALTPDEQKQAIEIANEETNKIIDSSFGSYKY